MSSHICTADDFHPYQCSQACIHCRAEVFDGHDPRHCWLCWDGDPDGPEGPCCTVKNAIADAKDEQ